MSLIDKFKGAVSNAVHKMTEHPKTGPWPQIDAKRAELKDIEKDLKKLGWGHKAKREALEERRSQVVKDLAQLEKQLDPLMAKQLQTIRNIRD